MNPLFLLLAVGSLSSLGADTFNVDAAGSNAKAVHDAIVTSFKNMRFVLAIFPVVAVLFVMTRTYSKLSASIDASQGQKQTLSVSQMAEYLIGFILTVTSVYLILGIFGVVFAKAGSMDEVWGRVVQDFWESVVSQIK